MQSYVETSRTAIQRLLAEINKKPVAIARKGNYMAFLTMPEDDQEARCERGACLTKDCYEVGENTVCRFCHKDEYGRLRNEAGEFLPR